MDVVTGLEQLISSGFEALLGKRIGIVCNQATIDRECNHFIDRILPFHQSKRLEVSAVFGPQHGIWGHTQDNMIEWEGYIDSRTKIPFFSLYGEHREPRKKWLQGLDMLVIDLPDIGSRYYTFLWTLALCLKACEPLGIPVLVLDRPNPLGGIKVEGTVGLPEFSSFVGLYPIPMRHGMTLGEVAQNLRAEFFPKVQLQVQRVLNWGRIDWFSETGLPWAMPSPNMPTLDTATVYPGGCLIEGTNLSEGRGTTRPFEMIGAPFLDGWQLAAELNSKRLSGVYFRPISFQPTFQKWAGELCGGVMIHVQNRDAFEPVLTFIALMQSAWKLSEGKMSWNPPPYEYEEILLPIDILSGNSWLRVVVEKETPLVEIREKMALECTQFAPIRSRSLLY